MTNSSENFRHRYEAMETDELTALYIDAGLTDDAELILIEVLRKRGIVPEELLIESNQKNENEVTKELEEDSVSFFDSQRMEEIDRLNSKPISKPEYSYNTKHQSSSITLLIISSTLMAVAGIVVAFFLFSKANSGWSGLDNRMIVAGIIVLIYQSIISYLCFRVAKLEERIFQIEKTE